MTFWLPLACFAVLMGSLAALHRLDELHHGYYGAVLCWTPLLGLPSWLWWLGLYLLVDDTIQHLSEAIGIAKSDWTPVHRLGDWLVTQFHWD